jgi:LmbE family N-acetylglucosaminyl deacetylase
MNTAESRLVLVFAPHPDDEAIAVGGTIAQHRSNGDRVIIVFVTDGSESHAAVLGIHDDPVPAELARIRQGEALEAAAKLCVPAQDVVQFHLQDTRVSDDANSLSIAIDALLRRLPRVDTIYLPDPDRELNADHRVTGSTVIECIHRLGLEPSLFKYVVWDKDLEKAFEYQNRLNVPASINDDEPLIVYDIEPFHKDKMAALAEHKTQVTMFSKSQVRTVVPPWLMHKLQTQMSETFRIHPLRPQESNHGDVIVRSFEEAGTGQ